VNIYHATSLLDEGACGHYPEWEKVAGHQRRSIIRKARRIATQRIAAGQRDAETIAQEVQAELMQDSEFGSIMLIIGLAVLSAIIQWVVKKLLDHWFKDVT